MSALRDLDTDHLLKSAAAGNDEAAEMLLGRHRERLRGMIAVRLPPQLSARLDASDVVQDVMVTAHRRLAGYLREQPIAFYPLVAKDSDPTASRTSTVIMSKPTRETPYREAAPPAFLNDHISGPVGPSARRPRSARRAVSSCMTNLNSGSATPFSNYPEQQREIIVMRHIEQLSVKEIAAIMEIPRRECHVATFSRTESFEEAAR